MKKDKILVVGACGQIGTELTSALRRQYRANRVVAADLKLHSPELEAEGPYQQLDALCATALATAIDRHDITQVYLLAALLSATGEQYPQKAWQLNTQSLLHTLELAREKRLVRVFWPSTIAVFGPQFYARRACLCNHPSSPLLRDPVPARFSPGHRRLLAPQHRRPCRPNRLELGIPLRPFRTYPRNAHSSVFKDRHNYPLGIHLF